MAILFGRSKEKEKEVLTVPEMKCHVQLAQKEIAKNDQSSPDLLKGKGLKDLLDVAEILEIEEFMNISFSPSGKQTLCAPSFCSTSDLYKVFSDLEFSKQRISQKNGDAGSYSLSKDIYGNKFKLAKESDLIIADINAKSGIHFGKDLFSVSKYVVSKYSGSHYVPDVRFLIHLMKNPALIPIIMEGKTTIFPGTVVNIGDTLHVLAAYGDILTVEQMRRMGVKIKGHKFFCVKFLPMSFMCRASTPYDVLEEVEFAKTACFMSLYPSQAARDKKRAERNVPLLVKSFGLDPFFQLTDIQFVVFKR